MNNHQYKQWLKNFLNFIQNILLKHHAIIIFDCDSNAYQPKNSRKCMDILNSVATDALVLKHQTVSIYIFDLIFIVVDKLHTKISHWQWTA